MKSVFKAYMREYRLMAQGKFYSPCNEHGMLSTQYSYEALDKFGFASNFRDIGPYGSCYIYNHRFA